LYGIFDEGNPNDMLGGLSIHCLNEFSQSFPIPNLSHLPPSGVYEAGQLWAFSREAAQSLRKGFMILVGLLQAQALLIYPLIIPRDISTLYRVFRRVGPPFELPFAETVGGEKIYMQAMVLDGDALRAQVELASCDGFETRDAHASIRFKAPSVNENRSGRPRHRVPEHDAGMSPFSAIRDGDVVRPGGAFTQSPQKSLPEIGIVSLASADGANGTGRFHRSKESQSSSQ
jgi:hypothetical protein